MKWSHSKIEKLAVGTKEDNNALFEAMKTGKLSKDHLSHAAEEIGRVGTPGCLPVLRLLLKNPAPMVREGALYGLGYLLTGAADMTTIGEIAACALHDPSIGVRDAAREVLDDLEIYLKPTPANELSLNQVREIRGQPHLPASLFESVDEETYKSRPSKEEFREALMKADKALKNSPRYLTPRSR